MLSVPPASDIPATSLIEFLRTAAELNLHSVAATDIDGGDLVTYGELFNTVENAAAWYRAQGLDKGDIVALLAPNVPGYIVTYLSVLAAGGTVLHLNPLDTVTDHVRAVNEVGARYLISDPALGDTAAEVGDDTDVSRTLVPWDGWVGLPTWINASDLPNVGPSDVASILRSSGTTGAPKSVELTHANIVATVIQTTVGIPMQPGESVLAVAPFHHTFGLTMVMAASLYQGATVVTMPRFDPQTYLKAIEKHRITRLYVVPTIVSLLARSPMVDEFDLSTVRQVVSGGAHLDPALAQQCRDRLGCGLAQGYGMTEAMMSFMQRDFHAGGASVGKPSTNVETKIVDIDSRLPVTAGAVGEVLIRGPHVMRGYHGDLAATEDVIDLDGFFRTGDLGYIDSHGDLLLVDRIREVIKYKGQQVSPTELEQVLMSHPNVSDAAVIGIPDDEASEIPKAFVVTSVPDLTAATVMEFVNQQVAPYKKVRRCDVVESIPRTPVGKVDRQALKRGHLVS